MRCDEAIERLLEADPVELRGRADTELGRHVAECERCGRVVRALLAELDSVDEALGEYAAAADPDAAAERVLAGLGDRGSRVPGRSWRRGAGVALAAAAALAALLLLGRDGEPPDALVAAPVESGPRLAVIPPPDRGVAVVETGNPKITIIWLYEREES